MFNVKAVIGANYGDEGKGMWTDYLVRTNSNSLVVRNNGGCQVGHTVVNNGQRYVFSHMGSGTLRGAPTFYTKYSVVNPVMFNREYFDRHSNTLQPVIFIDKNTPITTPFDMMRNQLIECNRGSERHGSVGVGFGSTLEREDDGVSLQYKDLFEEDVLKDKLQSIARWVFSHLNIVLKEDITNKVFNQFIEKENEIIDVFILDCKLFRNLTKLWLDDYDKFSTLIFENGQGLMLDQEYGVFPHVTRSNTGFRNISQLLKGIGVFNDVDVDVYYMSRCYNTRHGAGVLPYQNEELTGVMFKDETNIPNDFQGIIRTAPIDFDSISNAVRWDSASFNSKTKSNFILTCCDQLSPSGFVKYVYNGEVLTISTSGFLQNAQKEFDYLNWSPEGPQT